MNNPRRIPTTEPTEPVDFRKLARERAELCPERALELQNLGWALHCYQHKIQDHERAGAVLRQLFERTLARFEVGHLPGADVVRMTARKGGPR